MLPWECVSVKSAGYPLAAGTPTHCSQRDRAVLTGLDLTSYQRGTAGGCERMARSEVLKPGVLPPSTVTQVARSSFPPGAVENRPGTTHVIAPMLTNTNKGSVATFGITRESPLGGPRYTANPNTLWISRV